MAKRKQKNISQEDVLSSGAVEPSTQNARKKTVKKKESSVSNGSDNTFQKLEPQFELSIPESDKKLSEYEIFAGDNDFYKLLQDSQNSEPVQTELTDKKLSVKSSRFLPLTTFQKVLIAGIFITTIILVYTITGTRYFGSKPTSVSEAGNLKNIEHRIQNPEPRTQNVEYKIRDTNNLTTHQPINSSTQQPISLEVAKNLYTQRNYSQAYAVYEQLYQSLPVGEDIMGDYLRLQMGFCAENRKDYENAGRLFLSICESRSPAVRIVANYRLSLIELQRKRFLIARSRAYKALALAKAVDFANDWVLAFECDCCFLAAQCLTQNILSLDSTKSNLSDGVPLWGKCAAQANPFIDLSESQLKKFLNSGVEQLNRGLLAPEIKNIKDSGALPQFSVVSYQAPLEQVLAQFASQAELNIIWADSGAIEAADTKAASEISEEVTRQNPVCLYLPADNPEEVVLIAAGCTGLLAQWQESPQNSKDNAGKTTATIYNPANYSSLKEHLSLLSQHNISIWRRFAFTFNSDQRLGNVHFVMGLLYSLSGQTPEAIAEYKLVANRFSRTAIAPYALLQSSRLKTDLRDYSGARDDLRQLIDQYPDTEIYSQAYLGLADVTMRMGSNIEASQIYTRLYNYGLSAESKNASALGAARCYYATAAYQDAADWLVRYIKSAGSSKNTDNELYNAYFLLGKSCQQIGKYEQARQAFRYALEQQNSRQQYMDAVKALVQGYIEQENYVEALNVLENARSVALSEEQSVDILIFKSTVYRKLGITDLAVDLLSARSEYISNRQLKARILYEMAMCYIADEKITLAQKNLSQALSLVEPGALTQQIAIELADVCLQLGQDSKAISVCLDIFNSDAAISASVKSRTLNVLASAYSRQKEYDKAALSQMGQWK
jgi:tetratricopeptide (TPR) repeat protein